MLSPAALLAPPDGVGRLAVSLFAPETAAQVTARVRAYLAVAYADARVLALPTDALRDDAARHYAYAEAYDAKADLVHDDDAVAVTDGQGSRTTAPDQRAHWRARAAEYRALFEQAAAAGASGSASAGRRAAFVLVPSLR